MGSDKQVRTAMLALNDADILTIARSPGLGETWATRANVRHADLLAGSRKCGKAAKRVKAAILRDAHGFGAELAKYWDLTVLPALRKGNTPAGVDPTVYGVQFAAAVLGPAGTRALLACLADAEVDISTEVAERFDELTARVDHPLTTEELHTLFATTAELLANVESVTEVPEDDGREVTATRGAPAPGTGAAATDSEPASATAAEPARVDLVDVDDALQATRTLIDRGAQLAAQLRHVADTVELGLPAEDIGPEADAWSSAVRAHLEAVAPIAAADTLPDAERALDALRAAQDERVTNARKALETVVFLHGQGLDGSIPAILGDLGFSSVEEAEATIGTAPAAPDAATPATPDDTVTAAGGTELTHVADATAADAVPDGIEASAPESDPVVEPEPEAPQPVSAENGTEADPPAPEEPAPTPVPIEIAALPDEPAAPIGAAVFPAPQAVESLTEPPTGTAPAGLPDFPWDDPTPPLIAQLILERRYALACHVAAASEDTSRHQLLLRLTCAAACCSRDALELELPQLIPDDTQVDQLDTDEVRVLLAAALRAGLRLGYAPLGLTALIDRAELGDTGLAPVVHALAGAVNRGRTRENDQSTAAVEQLASRWAELSREAAELPGKLGARRLVYQRSSRVLHHLARDNQPVGHALSVAGALTARGIDSASTAEWAEIDGLAEDLLDQNKRDRLIAAADRASSGPQRRNPIVATARNQLHDELNGIGEFLTRLRTVRRAILSVDDIKGVESAQDVDRALAQAPPNPAARTVGDAAIVDLINWRRGAPIAADAESVDEVLDRELLAAFEIPRTAAGRPGRAPTPTEVAGLLTARDPQTVIVGYLAAGDVAAARDYIADHDLDGRFDDDILRAGSHAERRFHTARRNAELAVARLRSLYKHDLARSLAAELETLRTPVPDRWDLAITALRDITERADTALLAVHDDLRDRLAAVATGEDAKARVLDRLDHGDEALALEFLTMLEAGQSLPDVDDDHGDDFADFYPAVVDVAAAAQDDPAGDTPLVAARKALSAQGIPEDRQLRDGLAAWRTIRDKRRASNAFHPSVAQLLRMVGLMPASTDWIREVSQLKRSGYATYSVKASPVDRSYVPQLGTQAHRKYEITFAWDKVTPARLLDFVDERARTQPNIIFYFGVLDAQARVQLRNLTLPGRGKGFSPLVIDEAVIAWLSTRQEPGWRFTQRVTLPFATINPYTPFAGGEVPDEVFVGRDVERQLIESPTGSMFVYGGRQLGKSALLRRVERLFNEPPPADVKQLRNGNVAVYIDLKAAGIGEAQEPAALWPLLGDRLRKARVIPGNATRTATAADVTAHVKNWLEAEPHNRLLVLLDEADNFMTVDANAGDSTRGQFPVLQALKGIMESSQRRFKPVFAGLHQVQRFHDTSNTPVAHGGDDILIGPLKSSDAYRLVADPMSALGYRFASPELVWQLLLITNYQASLVQIVCEALVRHMQTRSVPADGSRIVVEERDVRTVCDDPTVQDLIAQRFRWTINLDSRYRVIALVLALRSRAVDQPATAFSVDDIREDCEYFWAEGFRRNELRDKEFKRYLDEMFGLGVLHRQGDQFGLRSPSIVRMLGSQEALDRELEDAGMHLEAAVEYNPTRTRQVMGDSGEFWSQRSPLTDHDLAQLLARDTTHPVRVVVGSPALGIDRAAAAITGAAEMKNIHCLPSDRPEVPELNQHHFGRPTHAIVDLTRWTEDENLAVLVKSLSGRANLTATIIVGPQLLASADELGVPIVPLRRWSLDGLRALSDSPFNSPVLRERLFRVTSGWPGLVEQAMRLVNDGRPTDGALAELVRTFTTPETAERLLTAVAVDPEVARRWATWFTGPVAEDGLVESEPASIADLTEALGYDAEPLLVKLEALDLVTKDNDGWVLDRVVLAAAVQTAA